MLLLLPVPVTCFQWSTGVGSNSPQGSAKGSARQSELRDRPPRGTRLGLLVKSDTRVLYADISGSNTEVRPKSGPHHTVSGPTYH
jgi:hypothetical protein